MKMKNEKERHKEKRIDNKEIVIVQKSIRKELEFSKVFEIMKEILKQKKDVVKKSTRNELSEV